MKKQLLLLLLGCTFILLLDAQNITKVEYFFNTDPGFGNGINVPITNSVNVSASFSPNMSSLAEGTHRLYIRSLDANGRWSNTNARAFYKANLTSLPNVSKVEYFFDIDPGFGNGINVPITSAVDVSTSFSPNISSLAEGVHRLYVRSLDVNGKWSNTNARVFYKVNLTSLPNISKLEYFIDTDPGFGNGINVPITPATNIANIVFTVNTTPLSIGSHKLFVRTKDAAGSWCITNVSTFTKSSALPLNLLSFNAVLQNKQVLTQWQTTNEVNVSHMNLQRSVDGINFSSIGRTEATGNGSYNFTDATLPANAKTLYYRLEIVDNTGEKQFSKIIAVQLAKNNMVLNVFPNPVKNQLFASINSVKQELVTIQVTDLQGKILQNRILKLNTGNNNFNITTSTLAKGVYLLVIKGEFLNQKMFVKE